MRISTLAFSLGAAALAAALPAIDELITERQGDYGNIDAPLRQSCKDCDKWCWKVTIPSSEPGAVNGLITYEAGCHGKGDCCNSAGLLHEFGLLSTCKGRSGIACPYTTRY